MRGGDFRKGNRGAGELPTSGEYFTTEDTEITEMEQPILPLCALCVLCG
jgi:hypothetical protein